MPKEQGHFGERAPRSNLKNAKEKNNSATLRASQSGCHRQQSGMGDMRNHMRCCDSEKESEKDSGYSEAGSDSLHTDVDDQCSSVSEHHMESRKNTNHNIVNDGGDNMLPYEELTPIYIIKNLVAKPSRAEQVLRGPVAWGGGWHSLTSAKASTQLLLIQQSSLPAPSASMLTPSSTLAAPQGQFKKGGSHGNQNHKSKTSYLPILNSYPRIAPHPRKESHESELGKNVAEVKDSGSEGQSKRVCIDEGKKEAFSTTSHPLKPQLQKQSQGQSFSQYKGRGRNSFFPTSQHNSQHSQQGLIPGNVSSHSISSSQTPSPSSSTDSPSSSSRPSSSPYSSTAQSPYCLALDSSSTRQRRFLNTAEILNQSGLLAITLRTKELLKQNAATEKEIAQLHQHTHLLCQVGQASQNGCNKAPDSLSKLLQAMTESGFYPNLDINCVKALSSNHQQSKSRSEEQKETDNNAKTAMAQSSFLQLVCLGNVDDGTSPPSPLFAPSPDGEEHRAC
ncbi:hypothetical protein Q5P01_019969 [Channa striata]|uniref:Uncharacterized protein n=1 Tax=Channa striata TaxID=64152 RepID=A0AA88M2C1_CHASR|nr:hypothetical protein Q5P01_019969 [Channa striata]